MPGRVVGSPVELAAECPEVGERSGQDGIEGQGFAPDLDAPIRSPRDRQATGASRAGCRLARRRADGDAAPARRRARYGRAPSSACSSICTVITIVVWSWPPASTTNRQRLPSWLAGVGSDARSSSSARPCPPRHSGTSPGRHPRRGRGSRRGASRAGRGSRTRPRSPHRTPARRGAGPPGGRGS